jgi:hypothetical protein
VGDEDKRRAVAVAQVHQEAHDRLARRAVEVAGRLVRKQDLGPRRGGAGQGHALLFAARHLAGVVLFPRAEAHGLKLRLGAVEGVGMTGQFQGRGHVFQRGHGRNKVEGLEHHPHMFATETGELVFVHRRQVAPECEDLTAGGAFQTAHEHEERGFAGPRRPRERDGFAAPHGQRDAVQDIDGAGVAVERETRVLKDQNGIFHD